MKLPGMTSHFLKNKFKGASDSWQFLDHYMRSWNCQELLSLNGTRIGFLLQCTAIKFVGKKISGLNFGAKTLHNK